MNWKDIRILVSIMFVGILLVLALVSVLSGCSSPAIHSVDSKANYSYVFGDVTAPPPMVVQSHVERLHRTVFGMIPLRSQYNGNWEFELVVSSNWLAQVKKDFTEIPFSDVPSRQVPEWFSPSPDVFTAWKMQPTSYPVAHLFVERNPPAKERIRVFVRRH
jgi:hypothetical protein